MENPNLSNEAKILLLCSRINLAEAEQSLLKDLIQKDINWQNLLKFAGFHRITSLLYKNLSLVNCQQEEAMEKAKKFYFYMLNHNNAVYETLHYLTIIFNKKNIKIIIAKGAVLAKLIYQDIGLRPMADIDILVHPEDWPQVRSILKDSDYRVTLNNYYTSLDPLGLYILAPKLNLHPLYVHNKNVVTNYYAKPYDIPPAIEAKFSVFEFDFYKNTVNELWKDAIDLSIDGIQSLMLCHEDMLLGLCLGFNKYHYSGLMQYCDLNEAILKFDNSINWEMFIKKARDRSLEDFVYFAFYHLKRLFNTPLPQNILKEFNPSKVKIFLFNKIFSKAPSLEISQKDPAYTLPHEIRFSMIIYRFTNFKIIIKIIDYLLSCIFPKPRYLLYRYNITSPIKIPIYYIKRICRASILLLKVIKVSFIKKT